MASATQQPTPVPDDGSSGGDAGWEDFGDRLAAAIEERGWTLARAAREISRHLPAGEVFNPVNLSHYVHGRSFPRPKYRNAIMRAFDFGEMPDPGERKRPRGAARQDLSGVFGVRVQDRGDGTARVQIDQVVTWPNTLRLLQMLMQKQN